MKRLHVSLAVEDLSASIQFYSELFAAEPTVRKSDYAKWMLDDPRVNFSISDRAKRSGVEHFGIQVENPAELEEVYGRLKSIQAPVLEAGASTCCYAHSDKNWVTDPQGVSWEVFLTHGESQTYGDDTDIHEATAKAACC